METNARRLDDVEIRRRLLTACANLAARSVDIAVAVAESRLGIARELAVLNAMDAQWVEALVRAALELQRERVSKQSG